MSFSFFLLALSVSLHVRTRQQHTLVINSKSNNRRRLHSHHGIRAFGLQGLRPPTSHGHEAGGWPSSRPYSARLDQCWLVVLWKAMAVVVLSHLILIGILHQSRVIVTADFYWPSRSSWQEASPSGACGAERGLAYVWSRGSLPRVGPCLSSLVAGSPTGWIYPEIKSMPKNVLKLPMLNIW